jgi:hypothetical protein
MRMTTVRHQSSMHKRMWAMEETRRAKIISKRKAWDPEHAILNTPRPFSARLCTFFVCRDALILTVVRVQNVITENAARLSCSQAFLCFSPL